MPKLTKTFIDSIEPPATGYVVEWDDELRGFGVRVMSSGTVTYIANYRTRAGLQRRISIGRHGPLSPQQARKQAIRMLGEVANEHDPLGEREEARREPTFRYLAEEYIKRHAIKKKSGKEDIRIINKDLLPAWGSKHTKEISRRVVVNRLAAIQDRGAPIAANRTLALIRKMFNFGIDHAIVDANPSLRLTPLAKEHQKDRFLAEHEIRTLWERLPKTDASLQIQLALKLILVTAQRPGEVICAEWKEFDSNTGWWTIPAERSKNGHSHRVPLSALALSLLSELNTKTRFLFPSPRNEDEPIQVNALGHAVRRNLETMGMEKFTPHDLRRTAASHMASAGIPRLVLSKILNHVERGITAVYDRHGYDQEKVSALTAWNDRLASILDNLKPKVVAFTRNR
jgi:integrase